MPLGGVLMRRTVLLAVAVEVGKFARAPWQDNGNTVNNVRRVLLPLSPNILVFMVASFMTGEAAELPNG